MRKWARAVLSGVAVLAALGVSGCGGSAGSVAGATAAATTRALQRTPTQVLAATSGALRAISSFHIAISGQRLHGIPITIDATLAIPGRADLTYTEGLASYQLVLASSEVYLNANAPYWIGAGAIANAVPLLAGRWVRMPAATPTVAWISALTHRATIGACSLSPVGTITVAPTATTIDGIPAVELIEHGSAAADVTQRLYISAVGPSLPVREVDSGSPAASAASAASAAAPSPAGCGTSTGRSESAAALAATASAITGTSVITYSRYDDPVHITAPAGAIDLRGVRNAALATAPRPAPASGAALAQEDAQVSELLGTWRATGEVTATQGFAGETVGARTSQVWEIARLCTTGDCPLYLTRTASGGPVTAPLVWAGGHWTADFAETIGCSDGATDTDYNDWTLTVGAAGIDAVESTHTAGVCGGVATHTIDHGATRTAHPASTTASA